MRWLEESVCLHDECIHIMNKFVSTWAALRSGYRSAVPHQYMLASPHLTLSGSLSKTTIHTFTVPDIDELSWNDSPEEKHKNATAVVFCLDLSSSW